MASCKVVIRKSDAMGLATVYIAVLVCKRPGFALETEFTIAQGITKDEAITGAKIFISTLGKIESFEIEG